jgi:hypothetical protein
MEDIEIPKIELTPEEIKRMEEANNAISRGGGTQIGAPRIQKMTMYMNGDKAIIIDETTGKLVDIPQM